MVGVCGCHDPADAGEGEGGTDDLADGLGCIPPALALPDHGVADEDRAGGGCRGDPAEADEETFSGGGVVSHPVVDGKAGVGLLCHHPDEPGERLVVQERRRPGWGNGGIEEAGKGLAAAPEGLKGCRDQVKAFGAEVGVHGGHVRGWVELMQSEDLCFVILYLAGVTFIFRGYAHDRLRL